MKSRAVATEQLDDEDLSPGTCQVARMGTEILIAKIGEPYQLYFK